MNVTADTNVILRAIITDDVRQSNAARKALAESEIVVVTTAALCEAVWVMMRGYNHGHAAVAEAIRKLVSATNVVTDQQSVEAGLAMLDAGGDFADGVIALEGAAKGGATFLSFDKRAVKLLSQSGRAARLL